MPFLALLLACASPEPPKSDPPRVAPPPKPAGPSFDYAAEAANLNVILISMDALRFDHSSLGGADTTPNLAEFAKEAAVFTHATAAAPWTVPSHMAIWTARWPSLHGVVNKLKPGPDGKELIFDALREDIQTYPQTLVAKGWKGAAFTGGAGVQARFGYGRGFETYLDDKPFAGMDYSGPAADTWLRANKDNHFFLFFHGYDAHGQHPLIDQKERAAVPSYTGTLDGSIEEQARLREKGLAAIVKPGDPPRLDGLTVEDAAFLLAVYDAKIRESDARLGKFLATVKELGLLDKSIIVVLADHGEEFMEHGYIDHGATLCEHQLHVPLVIRFPKGVGAGRIDAPVRTIDTFPTVFDALGVEQLADVSGKSLIPLLQGEKLDLPIYAESDYRLFVHLRSVRQGDRKLVLDLEDGQKTLFDLGADPGELTDLSAGDPRTTYEMEQGVRGWMETMRTNPDDYLGKVEQSITLF